MGVSSYWLIKQVKSGVQLGRADVFSFPGKVLGPFGDGFMGFWGRSDFSIGAFPAYLATQCPQNHFAR